MVISNALGPDSPTRLEWASGDDNKDFVHFSRSRLHRPLISALEGSFKNNIERKTEVQGSFGGPNHLF